MIESLPSGPDEAGTFSIDGQCPLTAASGVLSIGTVLVTGLLLDGELQLVAGNVTHFVTLVDIPVPPGTLATVVPEPGSAALLALGIASLSGTRRIRAI